LAKLRFAWRRRKQGEVTRQNVVFAMALVAPQNGARRA